jgi:hypothetical protein
MASFASSPENYGAGTDKLFNLFFKAIVVSVKTEVIF